MTDVANTVAEPDRRRRERVRFCSRCAAEASREAGDRPRAVRVCSACGMGVYLECAPEALGTLGTFFLVVTGDLVVSAVSQGAEELFGPERSLLGSRIETLVSCPLGDERMARTLRHAARGARDAEMLPLEPVAEDAGGFGALEAHVSTCGPPRAALVAIEPAVP